MRVLVNMSYGADHLPPPYQSACFWPVSNTVLNSDLIQYNSINAVDINGEDFAIDDQYVSDKDTANDVSSTELEVRSVPPLWDKVEVGVMEFEMSLKSRIFPRIGLFNFSISFICDRNIFDPKTVRSTNVWFHESVKLKLLGDVLNIYTRSGRRADNWFQMRFSQLIDVVDPTAEIKFGLQINKAKGNLLEDGLRMDVTYLVSWVNSLTTFSHMEEGENGVGPWSAAASASSEHTTDDSPPSSPTSGEFDYCGP